jgi:hypothetical protein
MSDTRMRHCGHGMHPGPGRWPFRIAGMVVLGVVGAGVFALAFGWLVMLLWNWVMPPIFHLGEITYWQGFGILVLAKLVFGAMGGRHGGPRHNPWKGNPWRKDGAEGWPDRDNWRYYRRFWEDEGHQAFEEYVKRQKETHPPGAAGGETADA